jgi:FkbM family methyltransferase
VTIVMLSRVYRVALHLPRYLGHYRITTLLRRLMSPGVSVVDHGCLMQLDPQEWAQISILTDGGLEPQTSALFRKILRPGDTYVDVGAHVGYHALLARLAVGATGRVLALEPQPYNCNKILINAALNGFSNITTIIGAAGDRDGSIMLRDQAPFDKSRLTLQGTGMHDQGVEFEVPLWTLSTLVRRHKIGKIRLLKIDVEGYELAVLKGALPILADTENVIFEEATEDMSSEASAGIRELLLREGFTLAGVTGEPWNGGSTPENNVWARRQGGDQH